MLDLLAPRTLVALLALGLTIPVSLNQYVLGAKADTNSLGGPNRYLTYRQHGQAAVPPR